MDLNYSALQMDLYLSRIPWVSWTPTYNGLNGQKPTISTLHASYYMLGDQVFYLLDFNVTSHGSVSGDMTFTLPFATTYPSSSVLIGYGREAAVYGFSVGVFSGGGGSAVHPVAVGPLSSGRKVLTTGYRISVNGVFRRVL